MKTTNVMLSLAFTALVIALAGCTGHSYNQGGTQDVNTQDVTGKDAAVGVASQPVANDATRPTPAADQHEGTVSGTSTSDDRVNASNVGVTSNQAAPGGTSGSQGGTNANGASGAAPGTEGSIMSHTKPATDGSGKNSPAVAR